MKVLDVLYRVDLPDEVWLRSVACDLAVILDRERRGCLAWTFDSRSGINVTPTQVVSLDLDPRLLMAFDRGVRALPTNYVVERYLNRSWSFGSAIPGWSQIPCVRDGTLDAMGIKDMFVIAAVSSDGRGCGFGSFQSRAGALDDETSEFVRAFSVHLREAHVLRMLAGRPTSPPLPARFKDSNESADDARRRCWLLLERSKLSPRERQTFDLLIQGLPDKDIAIHLGISRHTVNQYSKSVYARFRVHSRSALMASWMSTRAHRDDDGSGARTQPRASLSSTK
jgi:DNA-binding CsgD family transcriptional regulator